MEHLKRQRKVIKTALTRIHNFVADHSANLSDIKVRVNKTDEIFKQFENVQNQIDNLVDEQDLEAETNYRADIEGTYFAIKSIYEQRIVEEDTDNTIIRPQEATNEISTAMQALIEHQNAMGVLIERMSSTRMETTAPLSSLHGDSGRQQEIRLPQIQLPDFDGTATDWLRFRDLFEAMVHTRANISEVEKLEYLQTKLSGEALSLIKHLKPSNTNYDIAWSILKNKYDKTDKVKKAYLQLLFEQPAMKFSTAAEMRQLYNNTNESVNALKVLDEPVSQWDSVLLYHLEKKLDNDNLVLWYRARDSNQSATFTQFLEFLEKRVFELESTEKASQQTRNQGRHQFRTHAATFRACPACSKPHLLYQCDVFLSMSADEKSTVVRRNNMCFNCLQPSHQAADCQRSSCKLCGLRHNTLLHRTAASEETQQHSHSRVPVQELSITNQSNCVNINSVHHFQRTITILPTAIVWIRDGSNIYQACRALLDSGSQSTLITEACAQRLQLKRSYDRTLLYGIGSETGSLTKGKVRIQLQLPDDNKFIDTDAYCLSSLTQMLPSCKIATDHLDFCRNLKLADPTFYKPGKIDVILGADVFFSIILQEKLTHPSGSLNAINTQFGWVIAGNVAASSASQLISGHVQLDLDMQLQRFWETEELQAPSQLLTPEEEQAEQHYVQHVQRTQSGRYVVRLPLRSEYLELGDSKTTALKRLHAMERRFSNDHQLLQEYTGFITEFIELDHMEPASEAQIDRTYYMPHHAVFKPSSTTTKLRVVFDASCKTTNGRSLNDNLLVGTTLQNDLFDIITKFRKYAVGFTGDIEKMYRQVLVHPDDRSLQRILWRNSKGEEPRPYQLKTITYGTAAAPFLATRTLTNIATEHKTSHPEASIALLQNFYVDDFMACTPDVEAAAYLKKELCGILSSAGFHLRKWSSNSAEFLETINVNDRETSAETIIDESQTIKTLGLLWDNKADSFKYSVCIPSMPHKITKRTVLSDIARTFDPMGWIAPVVVAMKIFMQRLWLRGIDWDQELPNDLLLQWNELRDNIQDVQHILIPRWCQFTNNVDVQLHGFADSSELAYSAVVYLRVQRDNGEILTNLLAAKSKVAPVKQVTLPRLELCAAVLMTRLLTKLQHTLNMNDALVFGWSDSTVVLAWLADHPRRWKTFVANRTSEIISCIPAQQWRHIQSSQNPADLATRGLCPTALINNSLWWHGPDVLKQAIPKHDVKLAQPRDLGSEERKLVVLHTITPKEIDLIQSYSDYTKLSRITAYILRFISNCKSNSKRLEKTIGVLTIAELKGAHDCLIKVAQTQSFQADIRTLRAGNQLAAKHKLLPLFPFIDDYGHLRVGGRINNSYVTYDQKHPFILDKDHHLTSLIVQHYHIHHLHAGNRQLQYLLALRYWIPGVAHIIKRCVFKCTTCMRLRAIPYQQLMGNIPRQRLEPSSAFLNTGVDFAGPTQVRSWKGRGSKLYKCWIALFVCMVTKAIHLELVSELSTNAFMAALRRFISRRGRPTHMYSDNGTNFVGANRQLREVFDVLCSSASQETITKELAEQQITWHFSPPAGPHFGGMWEAGVKSAKYHLRRVLADASATYEELQTLLCEIECCLNSRPLCKNFEGDTDPLTPGHFLILRGMATLPNEAHIDTKVNHLNRWQYIQRLVQQFWKKWSLECLTQLQQRPKWRQQLKNLQLNDVVILKDENLPPSHWSIGRISQIHPGADGLVRVVSVTTAKGTVKRPITKLCPLFMDV